MGNSGGAMGREVATGLRRTKVQNGRGPGYSGGREEGRKEETREGEGVRSKGEETTEWETADESGT